jgi:hypothetical protein
LHHVQARAIISCMQYTIRNVSAELDRALKQHAKKSGKSVNQLALEALAQRVGQPVKRRNLRNMPGGWSKREAARFEGFLAEQRKIDDELW